MIFETFLSPTNGQSSRRFHCNSQRIALFQVIINRYRVAAISLTQYPITAGVFCARKREALGAGDEIAAPQLAYGRRP